MTIPEIPEKAEKELMRYSPIARRLLFNRGIKTEEDARQFMFPSWEEDMHDPFLMLNMEIAVSRFYNAIKNNEKIVIYSDYDCDGIPGATILHDLLRKINYENFEVYIPDRHKEGYGLNPEAVKSLCENGANLLITIDLGITAVNETELAKSLGVDVIITDHHEPQEKIPNTPFILNPKQKNDTYPFESLCGSGVIFKFIQAFIKKHGEEFSIPEAWEKWLLDMVGLATLADMVPLTGENRVFAYYGMKVLRKTRRLGLLKLFRKNGLKPDLLQEDDITFTVCPRLNAASRMDHPIYAFNLLTSANDADADKYATYLTKINNERKTLVATIMRRVHKEVKLKEDKSVIFIGDTKWRAGVLGLVAGKITEEYKKPAFVWGLEGGETIKGSCRSSGEVNLVDMMSLLPDDSFLEFGGHELAGGFAVSREEIHFLEERLEEAYKKTPKKEISSEEKIKVDARLSLNEVNREVFSEIDKLAPFGAGNPKPVFTFDKILISGIRKFGKNNEHIEITFKSDKGKEVKAIKFFTSFDSLPEGVREGKKVNLIAFMEKSTFGWKEEIRLRIVEIG
jgi:single-stranded-DNA-specific exonuclease